MRERSTFRLLHQITPLLGAALCAVALGGCGQVECGRPVCGCWEDITVSLEITVIDQDANPLPGLSAICVNEDSAVATSTADGLLAATFDSRVSEACGPERCNTLTITDPTGACEGTSSSLTALNFTTVRLTCGSVGDDDDSAR